MLRLSTDQIESIQREALINVPSRLHPSRFHVWRLNSLLQVGSVNIKVAFQNMASSSLDHLIVKIPANFISSNPERWSVQNGMNSIYVGIWGILHSFVGLKEDRRRYDQLKISEMVEERKQETLKANTNQLIPRSFYDDRLYGMEHNKLLQSMTTRIEQNKNHKWGCQSNALRAQFL